MWEYFHPPLYTALSVPKVQAEEEIRRTLISDIFIFPAIFPSCNTWGPERTFFNFHVSVWKELSLCPTCQVNIYIYSPNSRGCRERSQFFRKGRYVKYNSKYCFQFSEVDFSSLCFHFFSHIWSIIYIKFTLFNWWFDWVLTNIYIVVWSPPKWRFRTFP